MWLLSVLCLFPLCLMCSLSVSSQCVRVWVFVPVSERSLPVVNCPCSSSRSCCDERNRSELFTFGLLLKAVSASVTLRPEDPFVQLEVRVWVYGQRWKTLHKLISNPSVRIIDPQGWSDLSYSANRISWWVQILELRIFLKLFCALLSLKISVFLYLKWENCIYFF